MNAKSPKKQQKPFLLYFPPACVETVKCMQNTKSNHEHFAMYYGVLHYMW